MFVKVINAPKDADALTAKITLVTIIVHPMAVGVEDVPMCQTNDDPNAHAILLVVRAPRTDVNARAAGTRLAKERRARKM